MKELFCNVVSALTIAWSFVFAVLCLIVVLGLVGLVCFLLGAMGYGTWNLISNL